MKNLLTIIVSVLLSSVLYGQEMRIADISKRKFLVGENATVITSQDTNLQKQLLNENLTITLNSISVEEYKVNKYQDTLLKWTFKIPSSNKVVGSDLKLVFDDGTNRERFVSINVYSKEPLLKDYKANNSNEVFTDISDYQTLILYFDNLLFVDKIEFEDNKIQIKGTNRNSINANTVGFNADFGKNHLTIGFKPSVNNNFKLKIFYTDSSLHSQSIPYSLDLRQTTNYFQKKFKVEVVDLYYDDFGRYKYTPKIVLDFVNLGTVGRKYTIESTQVNLTTVDGTKIFVMPENRKIEVNLSEVKDAGSFDIKVKSTTDGEIFTSTLKILPEPKIEKFTLISSETNKIVRKVGNEYTLRIEGTQLHQMEDISVELVNNSNPQQVLNLSKLEFEEEGVITASIDFNNEVKIPVGEYYLRLKREVKYNDTTTIVRVYPLYSPLISLVYPTELLSQQSENINLNSAVYFRNKDLPKRFNQTDNYILEKNSRIELELSPIKGNETAPQYLDIKAIYTKADGNIVIKNITRDGNNYVTVFKDTVRIDLKDEFGFDNTNGLNPNEKITVKVNHSKEKYIDGNISIGAPTEKNIYCGASILDKIGITASLPPYLASFRNVKRKTITDDGNGNKTVIYDGNKEMEFQSLTINAGLGFKYRGRTKEYLPQPFAIGIYLMGLDFANSYSIDEQKFDENNHNFIGRGSFNLMCLGEYSFFNLDNATTRIPVYLGFVYVLDPIDGGSNFAPVFGFGIDIKLFGSN